MLIFHIATSSQRGGKPTTSRAMVFNCAWRFRLLVCSYIVHDEKCNANSVLSGDSHRKDWHITDNISIHRLHRQPLRWSISSLDQWSSVTWSWAHCNSIHWFNYSDAQLLHGCVQCQQHILWKHKVSALWRGGSTNRFDVSSLSLHHEYVSLRYTGLIK